MKYLIGIIALIFGLTATSLVAEDNRPTDVQLGSVIQNVGAYNDGGCLGAGLKGIQFERGGKFLYWWKTPVHTAENEEDTQFESRSIDGTWAIKKGKVVLKFSSPLDKKTSLFGAIEDNVLRFDEPIGELHPVEALEAGHDG